MLCANLTSAWLKSADSAVDPPAGVTESGLVGPTDAVVAGAAAAVVEGPASSSPHAASPRPLSTRVAAKARRRRGVLSDVITTHCSDEGTSAARHIAEVSEVA